MYNKELILAIDPGNQESGIVIIEKDTLYPIYKELVDNNVILSNILTKKYSNLGEIKHIAIEKIASYGMPVGIETFDTCIWIGRFLQAIKDTYNYPIRIKYIYRKDEKLNLCNSLRAKDSNIIQALVDRFAPAQKNNGKGTKNNPGWFYGFKADIWQAYAVAVTYVDLLEEEKRP